MSKPYIVLNIENINGQIIVTKAILYSGIRPHVLDLDKVQDVLINKYNQIISNDKIKYNRIIIDDSKIIDEFLSVNVSKIIKYTGRIIASAALIAALVYVVTNNDDKSDDKPQNGKMESTGFYQPLPNNGTVIDEILDDPELITPEVDNAKVTDDPELIVPEVDNTKVTDDPEIITPEVDYGNNHSEIVADYTYEFNFENRRSETIQNSDTRLIDYVEEKYGFFCEKYGNMYGVDPNLIKAMIAQENPFNSNQYSSISRGVTQIESISWGSDLTAYNYEQDEYETVTIDANSLPNPEYAIKIGCMVLAFDYNLLCKNYNDKNILSKPECIIASLPSYNKGVYGLMSLIDKYGNAYYNHINEAYEGDNLYIERILSFLPDNTIITFKNMDGTISTVMIDNLSIDLTL